MLKKIFIVALLGINGILPVSAETINLSIKKEMTTIASPGAADAPGAPSGTSAPTEKTPQPPTTEKSQTLMEQFTLLGFHEAITKALTLQGNGAGNGLEEFWDNIKAKALVPKDEIALLAPLFEKMSFESLLASDESTDAMAFNYEINARKVKNLFYENVKNYINYSAKTIFLSPDITIDETMNWEDLGVSKKENFTDVIVDSWAKWAKEKFSDFENVVVLNAPMTKTPQDLNNESVTLKWNSNIKKIEVFHERKAALFEVDAQYILVNTKSNQTLAAFDFPTQKREFSILKEKDLSSNLASLVYNLLNSQALKIQSALELNKSQSTLSTSEFSINGASGLSEVAMITSLLNAKYKAYAVEAELKQYSSSLSKITIRSTADQENLIKVFTIDNGQLKLNENKKIRFEASSSTFFIEEENHSANNN